jgi:Tfp pilus assembly protein PilF
MIMSVRHLGSARWCGLALAAFAGAVAPWAVGSEDLKSPNAAMLAAEINLQRGDCDQASHQYLAASEKFTDTKLAARAADVALQCGQYSLAEQAAARWQTLAPGASEAVLASVRAQLGQFHITAARAEFLGWLLRSPAPADADVAAAIDSLSQRAGAEPTLAMLRGSQAKQLAAGAVERALAAVALDGWDFALSLRYSAQAGGEGADAAVTAALRGRAHAGLGQADEALAAARAAAADQGAPERFALIDVLLLLDRDDQAETELMNLRTDQTAGAEARRRLAVLAYTRGNYVLAEQRFRELLSNPESQAAAVYYLSVLAAQRGDTSAALRGFSALGGTSLDRVARQRMAELLYRDGQQENAIQLLAPAEGADVTQRLDAELSVDELLASHGAADRAVTRIEQALKHYPQHPELLYQHAVFLERAGKTDRAVAALDAMHRDRPQDAGITNALGYTLADHSLELPRAEQLIREALRDEPDNPAMLDSLGWVLYRRHEGREALPVLERAFRLFHDGDIGAHWGEVLWSVGEKEQARAAWRRALAADPDNETLRAVISRFAPDLKIPQGAPGQVRPGAGTAV